MFLYHFNAVGSILLNVCAVLWGVVEGSFLGLSANNFFSIE